ncbi:MAG: M20/M25/M40 family metallo-hydrolase [Candidatus Margulisbacteria bacterium]|nr:M20/M25/M40 family metallo-hydrolase [Candidatus Margulisiibacteriota bacterium]
MINLKRLTASFLELVRINSESGHEQEIRNNLQKKLKSLGLTTVVDKKGNLSGHLKGSLKNSKTVLLSAHMDTVKPGTGIIPVVKGDKIVSSGKTVLGGDDKSGIAEILEVLTVIKENKLVHPALHVLFTVEEEIGVKGSRHLGKLKADYGFVLDTDGPIGTVVISAPTHEKLTVKVIGKSAHAGIEPQKGVNAIVAAAKAIAELKVGKIDEETVANIGIIEGGKATNIVPDEVMVYMEARSLNKIKLKRQIEHMQNIFLKKCTAFGATVKFMQSKEYESYDVSSNKKIISVCRKAAAQNNIKLRLNKSCGGSDANFFNKHGVPSVVISSGMDKVHTVKECIRISDMAKAAEFLLAILQNIA